MLLGGDFSPVCGGGGGGGGGGGIDGSSESSGATDGGEAGESGERAQIIDGEGRGVQHDHVEEGEVEADMSNTVPGHSIQKLFRSSRPQVSTRHHAPLHHCFRKKRLPRSRRHG